MEPVFNKNDHVIMTLANFELLHLLEALFEMLSDPLDRVRGRPVSSAAETLHSKRSALRETVKIAFRILKTLRGFWDIPTVLSLRTRMWDPPLDMPGSQSWGLFLPPQGSKLESTGHPPKAIST